VFLDQQTLSSAFLHQALLPRPIHSNLSGLGQKITVRLNASVTIPKAKGLLAGMKPQDLPNAAEIGI